MTHYAFRQLSPVMQLYWVLKQGTFLATRWEADDDGVNIYHCADEGRGFFVEVGVDYGQEQPMVLLDAHTYKGVGAGGVLAMLLKVFVFH